MGVTDSNRTVFGDDGAIDEDGFVIGTYLHGLFDNRNIRNALVRYLYEKKGLEYEPDEAISENDAYEELANVVEQNIDMEKLFEIAGV